MTSVSLSADAERKASQPQKANRGMFVNVNAAYEEQIAASFGSKRSLLQRGLVKLVLLTPLSRAGDQLPLVEHVCICHFHGTTRLRSSLVSRALSI